MSGRAIGGCTRRTFLRGLGATGAVGLLKTGNPAVSAAVQASQQSQDLPTLTPIGGAWTELGPRPFFRQRVTGQPDDTLSGQVSTIAVDLVHDPSGNLVYVGSSSGGVWKSTNGLSASPHFVLLSDETQSLSVGSIALDTRTDPPAIYVGTGDPDNPAAISTYTGVGILISRDGGQTWRLVDSADNGIHPFRALGFSRIIVDPTNPDVLLAAAGRASNPSPNDPTRLVQSGRPQGSQAFRHIGIYRSVDVGNTWTQVMAVPLRGMEEDPDRFFHIELVYEPTQGTYFAGISKLGLFASTDRGATWKPFQELGLDGLDDSQIFRVSLATRDGVLWALLMRKIFVKEDAFELFQSADNGRSWRKLSLPEPSPDGLFYGFLMYVAAPPNSNSLLVATRDLFRTDKPNSSWVLIAARDVIAAGDVHHLHEDQHAIAFASANSWYIGNDGGAWATTNRGDSWTSLNEDLRTLEFFSVAADSADSGAYAGGTNDNGPALTRGGPEWEQVVPGDGMYVVADPQDSSAFFMSEQNGNIFYVRVATPGGNRPEVINFDNMKLAADLLTPYEVLATDPRLYSGIPGLPPFDFERSRILLTGAKNPWLVAFNPDAASDTVKVRLTNTINTIIHYMAAVPGDATTAYLTTDFNLYLVREISFAGKAKVTQITGGPVNGDLLGHLAVSPDGTLYLIKVGFLDGQKIFKSTDGGNNWINISGNLPNTPLNWVTVDPIHPNFLFVASDVGVFVATDRGVEGEQWQRLGSGLPNVPVMQTQISPTSKLIAATYGRNVWTLDISNLDVFPPVITISANPTTLWPPNGKMVSVTISGRVTDPESGVNASTATYAVTDEYGLVHPSGHITLGSNGSYSFVIQLQASRNGDDKDGRQYIITVSAQDNAGNKGAAGTGVTVPHDQGH